MLWQLTEECVQRLKQKVTNVNNALNATINLAHKSSVSYVNFRV